MKFSNKQNSRAQRQAKKQASREKDAVAIAEGVSPAKIQKKNSAFKQNVFKDAAIFREGKVISL